jgi:hypothetical protein
VYERREAFLAKGEGGTGAAEFQKNPRTQRHLLELLDRSVIPIFKEAERCQFSTNDLCSE